MIKEYTIIRAERRAKLIDLLGGVCVVCDTTERLEFDHINNDREDIKHMVSQMMTGTWEAAVEEALKCQLLCKHHHMIKSAKERGHNVAHPHGSLTRYSFYKCRCSDCRAARAAYMREYNRKKRTIKA